MDHGSALSLSGHILHKLLIESPRPCSIKDRQLDFLGVMEWIGLCLPRTPRNKQSLLVCDSFRDHLTDEVKADLNRRKIDVAVYLWKPDPCFTAATQVLEQTVQRQWPKKVLGVDDQRPVRVYSG